MKGFVGPTLPAIDLQLLVLERPRDMRSVRKARFALHPSPGRELSLSRCDVNNLVFCQP